MSFSKLEGPVIAGAPPGFPRYWVIKRSITTSRRKRPVDAMTLISNPTTHTSYKTRTVHSPAFDDGVLKSPIHSVGEAGFFTVLPNAERQKLAAQTGLKLLDKIKQEVWNLGTVLGELPETQKWFVGAVREVTGLYRSVKKADKRSLKRLAKKGRAFLRRHGLLGSLSKGTKGVSRRWLEWRYAVSPLMYELDGLLATLYGSSQRPLIHRVAVGGEAQHSKLVHHQGAFYKYLEATFGKCQSRQVAYISVNPRADAFKRFGLINPLAVLWELTPLSFVVDWFLPIGDYIGHLDAMAGVTVHSCTYSTRGSGSVVIGPYSGRYKKSDGSYGYMTCGGASTSTDHYDRKIVSLYKPDFKFGTSPVGKQLIDAVALARVLLLK